MTLKQALAAKRGDPVRIKIGVRRPATVTDIMESCFASQVFSSCSPMANDYIRMSKIRHFVIIRGSDA